MKKKVLLVQLPMPQFAYHKLWGNIPLGGGYLKASALNAGLSDLFDIKLLEAKTSCLDSDARLIKRITSIKPDILGLTLYYWNGFRSLHIARRVKDLLPDMKVIVGGPEVTEDSEYILGDRTVDMGCIGQGERT
ncbi:MAG: cobalamin-dependent protein, partial [Thermodesulfobacteriota bacterium]|nr:cobalamin-dependent protein [Thermodesulfobacteriota bacterium]